VIHAAEKERGVCVRVCKQVLKKEDVKRNVSNMRGSKKKLQRKRGRDFWSAAVMICSLKGIIRSLTTKCALKPEWRQKKLLNWADSCTLKHVQMAP